MHLSIEMNELKVIGRTTRCGAISLEVTESSSCCGFRGLDVVRVESRAISLICLVLSPLLLVFMVHILHLRHQVCITSYQIMNPDAHGLRHLSGSRRSLFAVLVYCSGPLHNHSVLCESSRPNRDKHKQIVEHTEARDTPVIRNRNGRAVKPIHLSLAVLVNSMPVYKFLQITIV